MEYTKRSAFGMAVGQLCALMSVMVMYTDKRPLFVYSTSVSYKDIVSALNRTRSASEFANITMFIEPPEDRKEHYNRFQPYLRPATAAALGLNPTDNPYARADTENPSYSRVYLNEVSAFASFGVVSVLAVGYSILTLQMLGSGNENVFCDNLYGDHGVVEVLGWESFFWAFCWMQHVCISVVLSSPSDLVYDLLSSFAVTVLLALFCYIGSMASSENGLGAARRFEMPVVLLLCLCYVMFVSNTKIIVSRHFTYMIWLTYLCFDGLLVLGHSWDSPVAFRTVINSRWVYSILVTWMNVLLHVAF